MSKEPGIKLILEHNIDGMIHRTEVGEEAWDLDLDGIIELCARLIKGAGWPLKGELGAFNDDS